MLWQSRDMHTIVVAPHFDEIFGDVAERDAGYIVRGIHSSLFVVVFLVHWQNH